MLTNNDLEDIILLTDCKNMVNCDNYDKLQVTVRTMASDDSLSIYNPRETQNAHVVSLDKQLKGAKVDFIKMDIEGSEMEALEGSAGIIKEQHPVIAVCVYHRIEDLWEVPLYLKELCSDYKIYTRRHAEYWVSETMCYACVE